MQDLTDLIFFLQNEDHSKIFHKYPNKNENSGKDLNQRSAFFLQPNATAYLFSKEYVCLSERDSGFQD